MVFDLERLANKSHFCFQTRNHFVRNRANILEGLMRRNPFWKHRLLDRSVDLLNAARNAGTFANWVQNTEANAVALERGPSLTIHRKANAAVCFPADCSFPEKIDASLLVLT